MNLKLLLKFYVARPNHSRVISKSQKRQRVKRGQMDKKWTNNFDPLFPLVQKFWHLHMTPHRILLKPSGLPWRHKPSLWQQWRHVLSKNHGQAILTPYAPLCHCFNTVAWLSIEFSTKISVDCHGGTSRRYGYNDVMLFEKCRHRFFEVFFAGYMTEDQME